MDNKQLIEKLKQRIDFCLEIADNFSRNGSYELTSLWMERFDEARTAMELLETFDNPEQRFADRLEHCKRLANDNKKLGLTPSAQGWAVRQNEVETIIDWMNGKEEKKRLFIDQDGTLTVFTPQASTEPLYQEGYFRNLKPHEKVVKAVRYIIENYPEVEVFLLSAYLTDSKYALPEKNEWMDENLPEVDVAHRIFVPNGSDKKEWIWEFSEDDVLLDDFTPNLLKWLPARGIKLLNAINHSKGTWQFDRIRYDREPVDLANGIVAIVKEQEHIYDKSVREEQNTVKFQSAVRSNYKGYTVLAQFDRNAPVTDKQMIYLGKSENYDNHGNYDNSDNSLVFISENRKMYGFLQGSGWVVSQQEMLDRGVFTEEDYAEFAKLKETVLQQFEEKSPLKFEIDVDVPGSGVPFQYPNWGQENRKEQITIPPITVSPVVLFFEEERPEEFSLYQEQHKVVENAWRNLIENKNRVFVGAEFTVGGEHGQTLILTKSVRDGVDFQLTFVDKDNVPAMHENYYVDDSKEPVEIKDGMGQSLYSRLAPFSLHNQEITVSVEYEGKEIQMEEKNKVMVAIESTDDYTEGAFHRELVDVDVKNEDGTYGRMKDFYRIVTLNDDARVVAFDKQVFESFEEAKTMATQIPDVEYVSYDEILYEGGRRMANKTYEEMGIAPTPAEARENNSHGEGGSISFYVAECMEFTSLGEYHEGLSLQEAFDIYEQIPEERLNGGKGIGFILNDGSMYDGDFGLMYGEEIQEDTINSIEHYKNSPLVQQAIRDCKAELTKRYGIEFAEQETTNNFISQYYVVEDLQKKGAYDIQRYPDLNTALANYFALPSDKMKALGIQSSETLSGSLDFLQCKDGVDTLVEDYQKVSGWDNPEIIKAIEQMSVRLRADAIYREIITDVVNSTIYSMQSMRAMEEAHAPSYDGPLSEAEAERMWEHERDRGHTWDIGEDEVRFDREAMFQREYSTYHSILLAIQDGLEKGISEADIKLLLGQVYEGDIISDPERAKEYFTNAVEGVIQRDVKEFESYLNLYGIDLDTAPLTNPKEFEGYHLYMYQGEFYLETKYVQGFSDIAWMDGINRNFVSIKQEMDMRSERLAHVIKEFGDGMAEKNKVMEQEHTTKKYRVYITSGTVQHEMFIADTEQEAEQFCIDNHWHWMDENEFEWNLGYEEIEQELEKTIIIDGQKCHQIDTWEKSGVSYVLGQHIEDTEFFYARAIINGEQHDFEFDYQPSHDDVENRLIDLMAKLEIDRHEAEFGADGSRAFPHLNDEPINIQENLELDPIGKDDWFYNDVDGKTLRWVYFNPDSIADGQYVEIYLDYALIKDARERASDAEDIRNILLSEGKTSLIDINTPDFREMAEELRENPPQYIVGENEIQKFMEIANEVIANEAYQRILADVKDAEAYVADLKADMKGLAPDDVDYQALQYELYNSAEVQLGEAKERMEQFLQTHPDFQEITSEKPQQEITEAMFRLAIRIDQFSYENDPHEYADSVGTSIEERSSHREMIAEWIASGDTKLNDIIESFATIRDEYRESDAGRANYSEEIREANDLIYALEHLDQYEQFYEREEVPNAEKPIVEFHNDAGRMLEGDRIPLEKSRKQGFSDRSIVFYAVKHFEEENNIPEKQRVIQNGTYEDKELLYMAYDRYIGMSHQNDLALQPYMARLKEIAQGHETPLLPLIAEIYYAQQNKLSPVQMDYILDKTKEEKNPVWTIRNLRHGFEYGLSQEQIDVVIGESLDAQENLLGFMAEGGSIEDATALKGSRYYQYHIIAPHLKDGTISREMAQTIIQTVNSMSVWMLDYEFCTDALTQAVLDDRTITTAQISEIGRQFVEQKEVNNFKEFIEQKGGFHNFNPLQAENEKPKAPITVEAVKKKIADIKVEESTYANKKWGNADRQYVTNLIKERERLEEVLEVISLFSLEEIQGMLDVMNGDTKNPHAEYDFNVLAHAERILQEQDKVLTERVNFGEDLIEKWEKNNGLISDEQDRNIHALIRNKSIPLSELEKRINQELTHGEDEKNSKKEYKAPTFNNVDGNDLNEQHAPELIQFSNALFEHHGSELIQLSNTLLASKDLGAMSGYATDEAHTTLTETEARKAIQMGVRVDLLAKEVDYHGVHQDEYRKTHLDNGNVDEFYSTMKKSLLKEHPFYQNSAYLSPDYELAGANVPLLKKAIQFFVEQEQIKEKEEKDMATKEGIQLPEEKKDPKEQLKEQLQEGIKNVLSSENYKNWLDTSSKMFLNNYSFNNAMLVWCQNQEASYTMGYEQWKDYGRVPSGKDIAIKIFVPVIAYEKKDGDLWRMIRNNLQAQIKNDPNLALATYRVGLSGLEITMNQGGLFGLRINGNEQGIRTEKDIKDFVKHSIIGKVPMYFTVGNVFDVKDTIVPEFLWLKRGFTKAEMARDENGKAIKNKKGEYKIINTPERQAKFVPHLDMSVPQKDPAKMAILYDALKAVSERNGIHVYEKNREDDETLKGGADGYFSRKFDEENPKGFIVMPTDLDPTKAVSVMLHEMSHSELHGNLTKLAEKMGEENIPRHMREIQAESVAYVVGKNFGIETDMSSFQYLASFSQGFELQALSKSIEVIYRECRQLTTELKSELEVRGLNMDLSEREHTVMDKEAIDTLSKPYASYVIEQNDRIADIEKELPDLAEQNNDKPEVLSVVVAQSVNVERQKEDIAVIQSALGELKNADTLEKQKNQMEIMESAKARIEGYKADFANLSVQFEELSKDEQGLKDRFVADPVATIDSMKKAYPKLGELTNAQVQYLAKSEYVARNLSSLLRNEPEKFVDMACERASQIDRVASKNGMFVEVTWCEQWTDKPIVNDGALMHPKVADTIIKQAETQIRGLKAQAEAVGEYFPYNKCNLMIYQAEKGEITNAFQTRVDIGDGEQANLTEHLKQVSSSKYFTSEFEKATRERGAKEKIQFNTVQKQAEEVKKDVNVSDRGMSREAWEKEIGSAKEAEQNHEEQPKEQEQAKKRDNKEELSH